MHVTTYPLGSLCIRVVHLSDLHNRPCQKILEQVRQLQPDLIAVTGDLAHRYEFYHRAESFLTGCCRIAPTLLSLGNHDGLRDPGFRRVIETSGALLLNNGYLDLEVKGHALRIGGLTSPTTYVPRSERRFRPLLRTGRILRRPDVSWLDAFCRCDRFKILLCHQPEYYPRYLSRLPLELVLSGHAHGGQWRIGSQGIFAPGQGFLPRLTGGVTDFPRGRLVISRGLSNPLWIPRLFNPREILVLEL